ncbi:MAG: Fpg/Nei family DNA glycosylase [Rubripirellula sp.]
MPEGHKLHRIAQDHAKSLVDRKVMVTSPQGRFRAGAKQLNGAKLVGVEAHGKHLFYCFSGEKTLHVHLGLYGKFRCHNNPAPDPRGAVRIRMVSQECTIDLNGPNQCELLSRNACAERIARIGADPLREDADVPACCETIRRSRARIGALLMNQQVIAGIGNIYRSEILHRLGIHPLLRGCDLTSQQVQEIWDTTVEMMRVGMKYNRIITKRRSEVEVPLSRLTADECLLVYKKEICQMCGSEIDSWDLGGRKVFVCPVCQPRG